MESSALYFDHENQKVCFCLSTMIIKGLREGLRDGFMGFFHYLTRLVKWRIDLIQRVCFYE